MMLFLLLFAAPLHAAEDAAQLYSAGIEKANVGEYTEAIELLQRALQQQPDDPEAILFELGRLSFYLDDCSSVEDYLVSFKDLSDDEELEHYADGLIDTCGDVRSSSRYSLDVVGGFQYDTNVIVEPSNPVDRDDKNDLRTLIYLTGGAEVFDVDGIKLSADYSLYQSLHVKLVEYNIQNHKLGAVLDFNMSDTIKPSVSYTFDYTRLEYENYSGVHNVSADVVIAGGADQSTELMYEWRNAKYSDSEIYPTNSERSGYRHTFGARRNINSDDYYWGVFLKTAWERAKERYWSNHMYGAGADINYPLKEDVNLSAEAKYERRDYDGVFPGTSRSRLDSMYEGSVELTYMLSDRYAVTLSNVSTINDSNVAGFDYNRNITSLFISAGVL